LRKEDNGDGAIGDGNLMDDDGVEDDEMMKRMMRIDVSFILRMMILNKGKKNRDVMFCFMFCFSVWGEVK
jgi:hypothetical protein